MSNPTNLAKMAEITINPKVISHFLFPNLKPALMISEADKSGLNAKMTFIKVMGTMTYIIGKKHNKVARSEIPKVIKDKTITFPK